VYLRERDRERKLRAWLTGFLLLVAAVTMAVLLFV
jgi:hypothetical protein